jgi:hypothetical protein
MIIVFTQKTISTLPRRAVVKHTNPTDNRPGAMQASERNLHRNSPSHF